MFKKILNNLDLIFLFVLSFFTRFWHLSLIPKVVFDEAHYGLYATKYFSHQYYFDVHPPLIKMLLAIPGFFGGIKPGFDFQVNSPYGDFNFLALRFLPALLGSLLVLLIYFFVKEIGFSRKVAFFSGFLILFDNALLVQSRFILKEIILVFFIFLALYLFVLIKRYSPFSGKWYFFNIFCGLALGAAISIKWTGFGALAIVWFLIIFGEKLFSKKDYNLPTASSHSSLRSEWAPILTKIGLIFILPLLLYFIFFALHFHLLPLACQSNCGEVLDRYLNTEATYFNTPPSGNVFSKFIEVNKLMLASHLGNGTYYYQSNWWTWPLMIRPIQYFPGFPYAANPFKDSKISYIYFFGNPIVWWLGILGILGYLYLIIKNYFYRFKLNLPSSFYSKGFHLLFFGYLIYLLPFMAIERFTLMYDYLPALVFSIILFSVFFEGILKMLFEVPLRRVAGGLSSSLNDQIFFSKKRANILFFGILIIVFLSFVFFASLTYGLPLTEEGFQLRMWLDTWAL